jgi:hypothetical protein
MSSTLTSRAISTSQQAEDLQDIDGHLRGGIPVRDVDALQRYWRTSVPRLGVKVEFGARTSLGISSCTRARQLSLAREAVEIIDH